jgi:hypothetical protein
VLSGLAEPAVAVEAAPSPAHDQTLTAAPDVSEARFSQPAQSAATWQDAEGTVHVQPSTSETTVSIRQFINYRMESVVEIHVDGQWISYPSPSVSGIQVHADGAQQPVDVSAGVTKPVRWIESTAVDGVFTQLESGATEWADSDPFATVPTVQPAVSANIPWMGPLAEGELVTDAPGTGTDTGSDGPGDPGDPGDPGGPTEPVGRPVIVGFNAQTEPPIWRFFGHVEDNTSVEGLTVYFGGLLRGRMAIVDPSGLFEIITSLGPNPLGYVSAYVIDGDGLRSELEVIIVS